MRNILLLYSLSPYSQTESQTESQIHSLCVGQRNLFSSCQFFVMVGNRFWFYILLMYLEYHTVVVLCQFFWFWREIVFDVTYILSVQYSCGVVSIFLVVSGNSSQNESTFLQTILLAYFIMIRQPMCVYKTQHSSTLYLSVLHISLVPHSFTS